MRTHLGIDEPRPMQRFRRYARDMPSIYRQGKILVVTEPKTARDVLAFRPAIFEERALLGTTGDHTKHERSALRAFTDNLTNAHPPLVENMRIQLEQRTAIDALAIAALDTFGPVVLGNQYPRLRLTIIEFMLIRINDHYISNSRRKRNIASAKFYSSMADLQYANLDEKTFAFEVVQSIAKGRPERISRLIGGALMGLAAPAVLTSAWLLYERRTNGALHDSRSITKHNPVHIIQEILRIHPPSWNHGRIVVKDGIIGEHPVSRGDEVLIPVGYIHTSEKYWDQPYEFMPERWEKESFKTLAYMPFSVGPRSCVAAQLAMYFISQTLKIAAADILVSPRLGSRYRVGPLYGPPNFTVRWSR